MGEKMNTVNHPTISVITVCLNAEHLLKQTIDSVLGQTFDDYEYIIIDGGSEDHTIDVIKQYQDHPHVRWISEPDKGIYDAMNKGVSMAKGEWLNFMNAGDCFASNDVLERIFAMDIPEQIKFLYSDNYYVDGKGCESYVVQDHRKLSILHQSSIYRKSLHEMCGQYIVTPQIIVSDLLFFASVPEEYFQKVDISISRNLKGGVSSSSWCMDQALCAKVVFRKFTFGQMLVHYVSSHLKRKFPVLDKIHKRIWK